MVYESKGCLVRKMMKVGVHLGIFAMASPRQNQLVIICRKVATVGKFQLEIVFRFN
jgi:hypothetical protein